MSMDDNDGQMIFGDLVGLKLPDICLTGEGKPQKASPRKLVPTGDRTRARCVTSAHVTICSTAVDILTISFKYQVTYQITESTSFNQSELLILDFLSFSFYRLYLQLFFLKFCYAQTHKDQVAVFNLGISICNLVLQSIKVCM